MDPDVELVPMPVMRLIESLTDRITDGTRSLSATRELA